MCICSPVHSNTRHQLGDTHHPAKNQRHNNEVVRIIIDQINFIMLGIIIVLLFWIALLHLIDSMVYCRELKKINKLGIKIIKRLDNIKIKLED